jgi:hypothetical protein
MARFVKDVTFPDGTTVQPGSVFLKTWRIRNDGTQRWPDNVVLTCAGNNDDNDVSIELQHMGYKNLYPYGLAKTASVQNEIKIAEI